MELADQNLHTLCQELRDQGQPGLRARLLHLLAEAAEALDWMNFEHGLQHLDIKPHNLFVVSNHLKVADFGLVQNLDEGNGGTRRKCGLTPLYAAPELLHGVVSCSADQYSLAIVYQQMLTGSVPFWHPQVTELVHLHRTARPDLSLLPETDHAAVARALAKDPEERFPSCQEFIQALKDAQPLPPARLRLSGAFRRVVVPPLGPASGSSADQATRMLPSGTPSIVPSLSPETSRTLVTPPPTPNRLPAGEPARTEIVPPVPDERTPEAPEPAGFQDATAHIVVPPGYEFDECLNQGPLGDLWLIRDARGQEKRALHLIVSRTVGPDQDKAHDQGEVARRLRELVHPALAPLEVYGGAPGRLVLVSDVPRQTLRDRFEVCQAEGHTGIPRDELLGYLRTAADALDTLADVLQVPHLGLNPRTLVLEGGRLLLADLGVVALAWAPTGQPAGPLNPRYSAPELYEGPTGPRADLYSLALIYAEALTGIYPRALRSPRGCTAGRPRGPVGPARPGR